MKKCPHFDNYPVNRCCLTNCKYYTEETSHRCMYIDTKLTNTDKGITDAELHLYKLKDLDRKEVAAIRRTCVERIRVAVALAAAMEKCCLMDREVFTEESDKNDRILNHPIAKEMGIQPYMLYYINDPGFMSEFGNPKIDILFGEKNGRNKNAKNDRRAS